MSRFHRSNEVGGVALLVIPITITLTRAELADARTSGDTIALANEKRDEAISELQRKLMALSITIDQARELFPQIQRVAEGARA